MITLDLVTPRNAMIFKHVRLQALQDTPMAFSATYADDSQLTDADCVKRASQWSGDGSTAYIALDTAVPCGIAGGFLDKDYATHAHLASMWVAPTHRRSGIGTKLVNAIFAWASVNGARTLVLILTSNNATAIQFYERLGFTLTGKTAPYRNNPALNDLEMIRSISS